MSNATNHNYSGWDCADCGLPLKYSDIIPPTQHCRFCGCDRFVVNSIVEDY